MPSDIETLLNLEHQDFMKMMGSYLYESIGAQEFAKRHDLTQSACVVAPSTMHISFMKAITILGLGRENIVTVAVDEDARVDIKGRQNCNQRNLAKLWQSPRGTFVQNHLGNHNVTQMHAASAMRGKLRTCRSQLLASTWLRQCRDIFLTR